MLRITGQTMQRRHLAAATRLTLAHCNHWNRHFSGSASETPNPVEIANLIRAIESEGKTGSTTRYRQLQELKEQYKKLTGEPFHKEQPAIKPS